MNALTGLEIEIIIRALLREARRARFAARTDDADAAMDLALRYRAVLHERRTRPAFLKQQAT